MHFQLKQNSQGLLVLSGFDLAGYDEFFSLSVHESEPFIGSLDTDGYPRLDSFEFKSPVSLQLYTGSTWTSIEGTMIGKFQPQ